MDVPDANSKCGRWVAGAIAAVSRCLDKYQLAALTARFLVLKLFKWLQVWSDHVSYLNHGRYLAAKAVVTEVLVLAALGWWACTVDKAYFVDNLMTMTLTRLTDNAEDGRTQTAI